MKSQSVSCSVVFISVTPWTVWENPWDSPGKNTGVGSHFLLQGIFLTQELNLGLLHWRQMLKQRPYRKRGLSGDPVVKNPSANAGDARDMGSIPGSGRAPG